MNDADWNIPDWDASGDVVIIPSESPRGPSEIVGVATLLGPDPDASTKVA